MANLYMKTIMAAIMDNLECRFLLKTSDVIKIYSDLPLTFSNNFFSFVLDCSRTETHQYRYMIILTKQSYDIHDIHACTSIIFHLTFSLIPSSRLNSPFSDFHTFLSTDVSFEELVVIKTISPVR